MRTDNALCAYASASAEGGGGERVNSEISIIIFLTQAPSVATALPPGGRLFRSSSTAVIAKKAAKKEKREEDEKES